MRKRKSAYERYIRSPEWKAVREAALTRAKHRCETCASQRFLHVHHLTYKRFRHEQAEDLKVLCEPCHMKAHGKRSKRRGTSKYAPSPVKVYRRETA